jgi:alkylhydroperoxidase family enzyme
MRRDICVPARWRYKREAEYQALREHFTDDEIVELTWTAVAVINAWDRMAIGMHQPLDTTPTD